MISLMMKLSSSFVFDTMCNGACILSNVWREVPTPVLTYYILSKEWGKHNCMKQVMVTVRSLCLKHIKQF